MAENTEKTIDERMQSYLAASEPEKYAEPEQPEQEVEQESTEKIEAVAEEEVTDEVVEEEVIAEEEIATISEINELAEHIGADVSELYELAVPTTGADGAKVNVSLGELKDAYQENQKAAKVTKQAQEEYEALSQQRQRMEETINAEAVKTATFLKAAKEELTREFNGINWDALRIEDPSSYALRRQDFMERNGRLQSMEQQAGAQWEQQQQVLKQQNEELLGQYAQREHAALTDAIPEWRNQDAATAEKAKVADYLLNSGYRPEELEKAYDHRAIVLARKAMLWDEQQSKAKVATKKVLKIGKRTLKPGARQSKAQQSNDKAASLRKNLRKSGSVQDAVALYDALGG